MGRSPCCSKEGLKKGAWSSMEDQILTNYVRSHGEGKWHLLPIKAGLNRCGKSCRLRWRNYLRPDIKRGDISKDEEDLIIRLHSLLGNRWSLIAGRLPGRTDNEIKNYWNTKSAKRSRCDHKSPSKSVQMISKGQKREPTKHNQKSKDHPQPIRSKAIQCNAATKMLELGEEHDPLDFLKDIFVNQDQIHPLNPNSNYRSLVPDDDEALNLDHAHHDHSRDESTPPSLNPSVDINGIGDEVGSSFEWDYKMMSCEKHVEFDLMQELKRVTSLLDLEDEWKCMRHAFKDFMID